MKIKFWQFEYDFDRDDAKIIVPMMLLLVAISATTLSSLWLLAAAAIYYFLYFFLTDIVEAINAYVAKKKMRCPKCRNRKILLQGYEGYKSDEQYAHYFCDSCKTTSILTDNGLLQI